MSPSLGLKRVPTYLEGFDLIAGGGLPKGRLTLLAGTAGSGKTIFATQFLVEGIRQAGENVVFVTFEESSEDLRQNVAGFGWDIAGWEREGRWAFVDGSQVAHDEGSVVGSYDLGGLLARIELAVVKMKAKRVVLDSFSAVLHQFPDLATIRSEFFLIASRLKSLGTTAIVTAERATDYGDISRSGVEEFVADNVILLRNVLEDQKRHRTVEVLKFRGAGHLRGEFPATILPTVGMIVVPLALTELSKQRSSAIRVTSGVRVLDEMAGGGFFRNSVTLVSGATGSGKTLLVSEFLRGGVENGERVLLLAFEESPQQLARNASGWGIDFDAMERTGRLRIISQYPERTGPEEHLVRIKNVVDEFHPDRVVIDSLSAIERVTGGKGFPEFVLGLSSYIKERDITGLFTTTTERLLGGTSITDSHISTVTDTVILLRYFERRGTVHRAITILKMQGSSHDPSIRAFTITDKGMQIGEPLQDVTGILTGLPIEDPAQPQ
ncbi:MAG TPA: circadian clock protein KaiC [Candidatus Dormibacteraeota bacterium]|nr:circadian clock protein KaiC [Candidatus Dormibacteraeota bacterium]